MLRVFSHQCLTSIINYGAYCIHSFSLTTTAGSKIISDTITKDMEGFMDKFLSKYEVDMQSKEGIKDTL